MLQIQNIHIIITYLSLSHTHKIIQDSHKHIQTHCCSSFCLALPPSFTACQP